MKSDEKTDDGLPGKAVMGRRGFLFLLGAGIGLAGLRAVFRGGLPAAGRAAAGSGGPTAGNVSDVTARYWVRGDELAG